MPQVRLHVREAEGDLPNICMCCGQPATTKVKQSMQWHPGWIYIMLLVAVIIYIVLAMVMTTRATLNAPMCEQHKRHWFYRSLLIGVSFFLFALIGVGGLVLLANVPRHQQDTVGPIVCVGSVLLLVAWIVIVIVCKTTAIRPSEITDRELVLEGVCEEFVAAIDEVDAARRERKRERDQRRSRWDDEEDEPWPKKRPWSDSSPDGIQE